MFGVAHRANSDRELLVYTNADYACSSEYGRSIPGQLLRVGGQPCGFVSQIRAATSSIEAEYVALGDNVVKYRVHSRDFVLPQTKLCQAHRGA